MKRAFGTMLVLAAVLTVGGRCLAQNSRPTINGKHLDQWVAEIRSGDPSVREAAIQTVPLFGKDARKAGRHLVTALGETDVGLRINAVITIGIIGLDDKELPDGVRGLSKLLVSDSQHNVRFQAAVTLSRLGREAKAAIPQLCAAVKDAYNSWETRRAAAFALRAIAVDPKDGPDLKVVQALVYAAHDSSEKVKVEAMLTLLYLGAPSKKEDLESEKVALTRLVRDKDLTVGLWARMTLMRLEGISERHLVAIGQMLRGTDPALRLSAAQALSMAGTEAKSRVPDLIEALRDKDDTVVVAVMTALAAIGNDADRAIPALQRIADTKEGPLQTLAKNTIEKINDKTPKPKKAVP